MIDLPLVSVIVPVYNTAKYLRQCLDSICGQTYRNLEILCVNDGSTDESFSILEEYAAKDKRVHVFTQKNAGQAAARNLALSKAQGEWITGVDSDDYLEPDAYEYAISNVTEEIDIVVFGTRILWQNVPEEPGMNEYFRIKYEGVHRPSAQMIARTSATFCDKLWRHSLLKKFNAGFPVGLWYEDTYFSFTLEPFARYIAYKPEKKYNYIRRAGSTMSLTAENNPKIWDKLKIASAILDFYEKHKLPENMSNMLIVGFTVNVFSLLEHVPKKCIKQFIIKSRDLACRYNLMSRYPDHLHVLKRDPWWLKPFVTRRIGKVSYKFLGIPIITINYKESKRIVRLFCIKINTKYYE